MSIAHVNCENNCRSDLSPRTFVVINHGQRVDDGDCWAGPTRGSNPCHAARDPNSRHHSSLSTSVIPSSTHLLRVKSAMLLDETTFERKRAHISQPDICIRVNLRCFQGRGLSERFCAYIAGYISSALDSDLAWAERCLLEAHRRTPFDAWSIIRAYL
jgi:hypothetical protein